MTTEIVMCAYNGSKYIVEQLNSICSQTKKVDKITIYDDCSTDNTVEFIKSFIAGNKITNWELVENQVNKGWRRGFYDAIVNSSKDIVFFADQDDIWRPDKIEVMSRVIEENPNIMVLNAGFKTIDSVGNYVNSNLNFVKDFDKTLYQENILSNMSGYGWKNRIGCAMAITSKLRDIVKAIDFQDWFAHDLFSVNLASLCNSCYFLNFYAIDYRLHDNNCSNKIKQQHKDSLGLNYLLKLLEIAEQNKDIVDKENLEQLRQYVPFIAKRNKVLSKFAPFTWLGLLSKTNFYFNGKKGLMADGMDMLHLRKLFIKLGLAHNNDDASTKIIN